MASAPSTPIPTSSSILPALDASTQPTAPSAGPVGRLHSLKSTKDSTDNLRQRKAKAKDRSHTRQESSSTKAREFRVGNIGNNGLIYLRPVKRVSDAATNPTNASLTLKSSARPAFTSSASDPEWRHSMASGTGTCRSTGRPDSATSISPPPAPQTPKGYSPGRKGPRRSRGARQNQQTPPSRGTFKVVIDRAAAEDKEDGQLYNVPIPHYRLGAPHFTDKGSAVLHSSINTGSPPVDGVAQGSTSGDQPGFTRSRSPLATRPASHDSVTEPPGLTFDRLSHRRTASAEVITSKLRDFNEEDKRERSPTNVYEVRLSATTGQILAASIPELIVRITSPNRLDYDLLSDFFLTYRLFISPQDLAIRLIQRLQVSVRAGDGWSRIVRVRVFVALRHWILNYFVDDFVSDYDLRVQFCDMVNKLCQGLKEANPEKVGDLRILDELKRCWRHTCALFWDVPMPPTGSYIDQDIQPGGFVGSRLPSPAQIQHHTAMEKDPNQYRRGPSQNVSPESSHEQVNRAGLDFSYNKTSEVPLSSSSNSTRGPPDLLDERESMQVISCTIPATGKHARHPSRGPRPVPAKIQTKGAKHSQAGCGPARRQHNRSASFSDALRDDRVPLPAQHAWEDETSALLQQQMLPGTLIRGALLSPAAPYVEAVVPQSPVDGMPSGAGSQLPEATLPEPADKTSPWANPGVRRLIGSVRRALSARHNAIPPTMGTFAERNSMSSEVSAPFIAAPIGEPGVPKRKLVGGRTRLRVDLLAAEVSEAFKVAVREVAEAQHRLQSPPQPPLCRPEQEKGGQNQDVLQRPLMPDKINSNVTLGSRSIVIMDDTNGQITPKPGQGVFGIERNESNVISPGETVGSQRQDVPLFLDEVETPTKTSMGVGTQNNSTKQSSEFNALGIVASGDRAMRMEDLAFSPPNSLQLSEDGNLAEELSVPLTRQTDHLSAPRTKTDAPSFSEDSNTSTGDPYQFERALGQQLRRMPGGDLRGKNHVHSLDENFKMDQARSPREQSRSPAIPPRTTSANATHVLVDDTTDTTDPMPTTGLTMNSATTKPMVGVSFEKEVAKLAQLPDHEEEGGIECALRSLEGRGRQMSETEEPPQGALLALAAQVHGLDASQGEDIEAPDSTEASKRQHRDDEVVEEAAQKRNADVQDGHPAAKSSTQASYPHITVQSKAVSVTESEGSDSSIPLLERGASQKPRKKKAPVTSPPMPDAAQLMRPGYMETERQGSSLTKTSTRSPRPRNESFLLDDNETLSSASGIIPDDREADATEVLEKNEHHTRPRYPNRQRSASVLEVPRPVNPVARSPSDNTPLRSRSADDLLDIKDQTPLTSSPAAAHLPYVLAYDSLLLAQQFTVIERDALCEVEWRDLIDLRWVQSVPPYQSWVEFLKASENDPHSSALRLGVDICISRFNLVVRWAKSEIVLTQDIFERAATITKFIHVARHARRLRNWATMYQLTMALVGADVSRLKSTWEHVPKKDRAALAALETLIMPTRNFHNLREEIESATATFARDGEGGCIPFIGIYTHDLIYNAQKAMFVPVDDPIKSNHMEQNRAAPSLVNFERHHTAATIVKNLLRLIEASSKYAFQPVPEVASRCLWLGALSDAEIAKRSRDLEPLVDRTSQ